MTTEKNNIFRGFVYTVRFSLSVSRNCGEARDTLEAPVRSALMGASLITKPSKLNYFHSLSSIHVEVPPLHNVAIMY